MAPPLTPVQKIRKKKSLYTWTGALFVAGSLLLLNFVVNFIPLRLDTSEGQIFSITSGTKKILADLEDTLLIRMFFSSRLPAQLKVNEQYVRDLLFEYKRAAKGKLRVEYIDPSGSEKARQQAVQAGIAPVQLDVRERDRREVKECFMGLFILYGDQSDAIAFIQETQGLEYEISQRIKKLVSPEEIKIGFVTNGNPLTLQSEPVRQLEPLVSQRFQAASVDVLEGIPQDLRALWLIGPQTALTPEEVAPLKSWVEKGNTLGLLLDRATVVIEQFRAQPIRSGLEDLLKEWGIQHKSGFVVDPRSDRIQVQSQQGFIRWVNVVDYPYFPLVNDLNNDHPATKGIDTVSFPFVSPLVVTNKNTNLTYTSLARSSKLSWHDPIAANMSPLEQHSPQPSSTKGPFDLMILLEGQFGPTEGDAKEAGNKNPGRVIVSGTSRFLRTDFPPRPQNFSLFLNLLDWSVQDEDLLSIRAKGVALRPIKKMSDGMRFIVKYALMFALPILWLLLGFFIWRRQKVRRALLPLAYQKT